MATIGVKIELEGAPQYKENMSNLTAQTKLYQAQLKRLEQEMGSGVSAFRKSITESKALQQQLDAQKNQAKLLEEQIAKTSEKYGEDSTQVIRLKTQYEKLQTEILKTSEALKENGGLAGAVGKQFEEVGSRIDAVGQKISSVGDQMTAKLTTPIIALGGVGANAASSFESAMSEVAATMGYTVDELNDSSSEAAQTMDKLGNFAKEMGKATAFSAAEAAEALNYMALAGYDAETSMEMLPTVLDLAAAGNIDLASASDMVTDAQSALGLSTEETAALVDQMAKASSKSNTSVAQLGEAMLTIGATAANVSGGTAELATSLGVLADNGIKGAEGGTHLRNMILSLQDAAVDGAVDFGEFSVQVYDSEGNFREVSSIMQDLSSNMNGMSQESKDAIVSGIFNKTDLAAVNAMLGTSSERFDELRTSIEGAEGAASAMAAVKLDNLKGKITLLKSAMEGAAISIGEALLPYIAKLVEKIQLAVGWFNSLSESQKDMIVQIALVVAAIGPALSIIGRVVSAVGTVTSGIGSFIGFLPTIGTALSAVGAVITGTVLPAIGAAVAAIIPVLPIIAGVAAAIAAVILVVKNWGAITDWLSEKWNTLTTFLSEKTAQIQTFFTEHLGIIGEMIATKIEIIKTVITTAIAVIQTIFTTFGETIKAITEGDWSRIGEIWSNAWAKIQMIIAQAIVKIVKSVMELGSKVKEGFMDIVNSAKEWGNHLIQNFINGITEKISDLKNAVKNVAQSVRDFIGFSVPKLGPLSEADEFAPDFMKLFAQGIKENAHLVTDQIVKSLDLESEIQSLFKIPSYDAESRVVYEGGNGRIYNLLEQINEVLPELANTSIMLDSGILVGATAGQMDAALGQIYINNQRSV